MTFLVLFRRFVLPTLGALVGFVSLSGIYYGLLHFDQWTATYPLWTILAGALVGLLLAFWLLPLRAQQAQVLCAVVLLPTAALIEAAVISDRLPLDQFTTLLILVTALPPALIIAWAAQGLARPWPFRLSFWIVVLATIVLVAAERLGIISGYLAHVFELLLAVGWYLQLLLRPTPDQPVSSDGRLLLGVVTAAVLGFVIGWGAWLRITAIDQFDFQNDEYFHVETAYGYNQTGQFVQWNFATDQPGAEYLRARGFTWQVAKSFQWFGVSESSARLPALFWGLLLLGLVPAIAYDWTRSRLTAVGAAVITAFDNGFIWSSTTTRMYSLLFVLALLTAWTGLRVLRTDLPTWRRLLWGLFTLGLCGLGFVTHPVFALIPAGLAVGYVLRFTQDRAHRWHWWVLAALLLLGAAALLAQYLWSPFPTYFFTVRPTAAVSYLMYPFHNLRLLWLAPVLLLGVALVWKRQPDWWQRIPAWVLVSVSTWGVALGYFTFFADRYAARKYSALVYPLLFICVAAAWQWLWQAVTARPLTQLLGAATVLALICPLAIPGVPSGLALDQARADATYDTYNYHHYSAAYAAAEAAVQPGDALLVLSPQSYYMTRTDVDMYQIAPNRAFSAAQLQAIIDRYKHGLIVWPHYKRYHLKPAVEAAVIAQYPRLKHTKKTNVDIYQWGAASGE